MPVPKSIKDTWVFEHEGVEYTLGPVRSSVEADVFDFIKNDRHYRAMFTLVESGGVLKIGDEEATQRKVDALDRDTKMALGQEIFRRCFITDPESD